MPACRPTASTVFCSDRVERSEVRRRRPGPCSGVEAHDAGARAALRGGGPPPSAWPRRPRESSDPRSLSEAPIEHELGRRTRSAASTCAEKSWPSDPGATNPAPGTLRLSSLQSRLAARGRATPPRLDVPARTRSSRRSPRRADAPAEPVASADGTDCVRRSPTRCRLRAPRQGRQRQQGGGQSRRRDGEGASCEHAHTRTRGSYGCALARSLTTPVISGPGRSRSSWVSELTTACRLPPFASATASWR